MRIVLLSLCLLACSTGRAPPERSVDTTPETVEPRPTPKKGPFPDCEGFAEAEAARRARHQGPCPFCPCACTPERGVFCAPCVACDPPGPDPDHDSGGADPDAPASTVSPSAPPTRR